METICGVALPTVMWRYLTFLLAEKNPEISINEKKNPEMETETANKNKNYKQKKETIK